MIYVDGLSIDVTHFPDGTSQVWKLPDFILERSNVSVLWKFTTEAEFLHLAQLKDLLDSRKIIASLEISFLPYGRQDKEVSNTSTFALNTFAWLLNSVGFSEVIIHDPHSEWATKLIRNSRAVYPHDEILTIMYALETDIVCYPDKGAVSKYSKTYPNLPYIYGEKVRDQLTGNITSYSLIGDPSGKNVLIVDDICDGGMTFKILAKDLLAAGAKEVNLFVTHGIFSKGLRTLKDAGIKRVFTQDGEALRYQDQIMYRRLS
jgi:ribose-phosphate pyrophosphokinase